MTRRGTVDSFHQSREATRAAERVPGGVLVKNRVDVEILPPARREDAGLRGDVVEALMLDAQVPTSVDAGITDSCVTLSGEADWQYRREEAERVAGPVPGVTAVLNEMRFRDTSDVGHDIQNRVRKARVGQATLDTERLQATVSQGNHHPHRSDALPRAARRSSGRRPGRPRRRTDRRPAHTHPLSPAVSPRMRHSPLAARSVRR